MREGRAERLTENQQFQEYFREDIMLGHGRVDQERYFLPRVNAASEGETVWMRDVANMDVFALHLYMQGNYEAVARLVLEKRHARTVDIYIRDDGGRGMQKLHESAPATLQIVKYVENTASHLLTDNQQLFLDSTVQK